LGARALKTNDRVAILRDKLAMVPTSPGVYIHKSADGKVLYVGKAKNLQNRLKSYFHGLDSHTAKTRALVSRIDDFEYIVVDNENESLLLENNLIKHNRPPYNILLRDDKTYPYLKVTLEEKWPRVIQTRKRRNDGGAYFGPYSNAADLQATLRVIQRYFPLVKCTPNVFKSVQRPCNYYLIKKCLAPCKLQVDERDYRKLLERVVDLLSGKVNELNQAIKHEMAIAAEQMQFEKAALLRDQLRALEKLTQQQSVTLMPGFDADVIEFAWSHQNISVYIAIVRDGKFISSASHLVKYSSEQFAEQFENESGEAQNKESFRAEIVHQVVGQFYSSHEIPKNIFLPSCGNDFSKEQIDQLWALLNAIERDMSARQGREKTEMKLHFDRKFKVTGSLRGGQLRIFRDSFDGLCSTVSENAKSKLQEAMQSDEAVQRRLASLQSFLDLTQLPAWIECYDISTFQGSSTVASGVVFKDGIAAKREYRKYTIREVAGQDDFASLREVIRRRFKNERRYEVPDVLLVDGGEPQVREVAWLLKSLSLDAVPLYGIAKSRTERNFRSNDVSVSSERIVIPARNSSGDLEPERPPQTRLLKSNTPEFQLVTQIRNEAHRFAIGFHRKTRDRKSLRSVLSEVPGLGPKRRKKLLQEFGGVDKIQIADVDEIVKKAKIPRDVAIALLKFLNEASRDKKEGLGSV
jgi:excinuclease ABC subunit C